MSLSEFSRTHEYDKAPKSGRRNKGVLRAYRAKKREEAEERNANTPVERTAQYRRDQETERVMREQNVERETAERVSAASTRTKKKVRKKVNKGGRNGTPSRP